MWESTKTPTEKTNNRTPQTMVGHIV